MILGWALILLGIIGLFVPILQGVLLILLGLLVLSRESQWAHRRLNTLRQRFPAADRRMRDWQQKFRRYRQGRKGSSEDEDNDA